MKFSFVDKVKDGKVPKIRQGIAEALAYFEGKDVEVEIHKWSGHKSRQLEKYYHGVVLEIIHKEIGEDKDVLHELAKERFLKKRVLDHLTNTYVTVTGSTRDLTYDEQLQFVENVKQYYAEQGYYIPDPSH